MQFAVVHMIISSLNDLQCIVYNKKLVHQGLWISLKKCFMVFIGSHLLFHEGRNSKMKANTLLEEIR